VDTPGDLLAYLVKTLEHIGIPYALGGSLGAMSYGEPRFTRDIDVVIELSARDVPRLIADFSWPEFYLDEATVREAVRNGGQFNAIHPNSGMKIDFYVSSDDVENSQIAGARTRRDIWGVRVKVSPPEELITKKMEYYDNGGSDKHLRDILAMLDVSWDDMDLERVASLAQRNGLAHVWEDVLKQWRGPPPAASGSAPGTGPK
jgi:hypothetical protein